MTGATKTEAAIGGREDAVNRLAAERTSLPVFWSNGPGDTYEWHRHGYHKILFCLGGSITFHTRKGGDIELRAGDRLDLKATTEHAATVGPDGVECVEASK